MTASKIPLVDLAAAHAEVDAEIRAGIDRLLASGAFILGPDVAAFEAEFATFTGTRHCVGMSSGTDALELAMRAAGIGPGDEVIVPANTFFATAASVTRAGATPVFVDCDERYLLMDPDKIAERITARTRALVPVHLFGQMAPMAPIEAVAAAHSLLLFEDFAQAQGARQHGRSAGTCSLAAGTSFYPGKNLGAYGDAGAVVTDDAELAAALQAMRNYGSPRKYEHPHHGFNCRLDTLQAVVLRAKLKRLHDGNARRRAAAATYDELLAGEQRLRVLKVMGGNEHIYHLYVVRVADGAELRARVIERLAAQGIAAGVHYPTPLHLTGAYRSHWRRGDFPVAEAAAEQILSLPMFPQITAEQQERIVALLAQALAS